MMGGKAMIRIRSRVGAPLQLGLAALLTVSLFDTNTAAAPAGAVVRQPWRVLEAAGVRRDGQREPLISGDLLAPGARLSLEAGASVHLMQAGDLLLSVFGPAALTLGSLKAPRAIVLRSALALQLSGMGGELVWADGRRVRVSSRGATVLVARDKVYLRRGSARLTRPPSVAPPVAPAAPASAASTPAGPAPTSMTAKAARSRELRRAKAPAWAVAAVSRYRAPPRLRRRGGVSLAAAVKRVRRWTAARQQQAREMAACGCTEGSGPGGGANNNGGGPNGVLMLEGRNARLRVRVGGMPAAPAPKGGGS
jgi:hypothetical protein